MVCRVQSRQYVRGTVRRRRGSPREGSINMPKPDWTLGCGGGATAEASLLRADIGILGDGSLAGHGTPSLPGIACRGLGAEIRRAEALLWTRAPGAICDRRLVASGLSDGARILARAAAMGAHTSASEPKTTGLPADAPMIPIAATQIAVLDGRAATVSEAGRHDAVRRLWWPSPIFPRERLQ